MGSEFRWSWLAAGAGVVVLAVVVWLALVPAKRTESPDSAAPRKVEPNQAAASAGAAAFPKIAPPTSAAPEMPALATTPGADGEDIPQGWAAVDLDEVRKALPDNQYWKMSAPTTDPDLLKWREEERARWNTQYGKVLSGNASEKEIRDYYDQRAQVAGDDVEFSTYLLDHYGDKLPERDVNMLKLARKLNQARLEEIPRKIEEALARKQKQDDARAAWLADQKAFGADGSGGDTDPNDAESGNTADPGAQ